jgi:flagellin-specific chaperone FliS
MDAAESTPARAWLLAEARRLQKKHEAIRRRLEILRELMRAVCRRDSARRDEA